MELDVSDELYRQLSQRAEQKGFDSAEEYSIVIIQTVLEELEDSGASDEVESRLEDLGYLE
jgi:PHD/YefM family antitoxin component YafN of YafNO toxin-antitoxin module